MHRSLVPLLLSAVVLAGCASDPSTVAEPPTEESPSAESIEGLVVVDEELARDHVEEPVEYDRVPPVGGPHHPRWLACDVYDEPVPKETAVHSLEHGAVWFTYDPDLPEDQVKRLEDLRVRNEEYVLVSPMDGLPAPVVAAAWGVSLPVQDADDDRLIAFLERYAGGDQGGEPGAPCRGNGLTLREARGLLQTSA